MRSIRLSLIFYFLVLLTSAVGAVSWFAYRTTEESLRERQHDSLTMIESQHDWQCKRVHRELDRRILQQAHTLVKVSQTTFVHAEGHFAFMGIIGSSAIGSNFASPLIFGYESSSKDLSPDIFRAQPPSTHIENADMLVADEDGQHPQEYFQTYRTNGTPMEKSDSLGEQWLILEEGLRADMALNTEHYDEVALANGVKIRRVTLKSSVPSFSVTIVPWPKGVPTPLPAYLPKGGAGVRPQPKERENYKDRDKNKGPKGTFQRPTAVFEGPRMPVIFVQYAADLSQAEAKIADLHRKRDDDIAGLQATIDNDLKQLRERMLWIGLGAFVAVWVGGYLVIRLGLAPLSKMSDAVRQVTPANIHLPLDRDKLPKELQPIAERLAIMLDELQKAFAREKQAAADISHELRTPLAALMTTLEVGLKKMRSPAEYREILEECQNSGQHMYQLVERLLTLARLDAGVDQYRPVEADITEIALNCADLIRPLAKARGLALRLHLADPIATQTDPNKLREVITNLLHNAVEYNNPNGAIDLAVERVNNHIQIEVRDTGIGIKPEQMEHLFERFYRADPSRHAETPHAGLGLAIVKSYVELMGGKIRVDSSPAGTTFTVELPFVAPAHDPATAVQEARVLAAR
jgi:heavy metal sensor kinase